MKSLVVILAAAFALGFAAVGCKGSSCESLCKEAQDRSCTSIHGDCNAFCAASDDVSTKQNCTDLEDAYHSCLANDDVCTGDSRCASQKSALEHCAETYCSAHSSDGSCKTLLNSL